jgi:exosortase/archaeosortase family protein
MRPEFSFLLRFALIAGVLSALYAFPYPPDAAVSTWLAHYLDAYAAAAGAVVALFDPAVHVTGAELVGRYSLRIVKDCDAMDVTILLVAAMLAFPASAGRRAMGLAGGVAVVLVANLARISALYFIGVSAPGAFEFAHRDLFPLLLVLLAGAVFVLWARKAPAPMVTHAA